MDSIINIHGDLSIDGFLHGKQIFRHIEHNSLTSAGKAYILQKLLMNTGLNSDYLHRFPSTFTTDLGTMTVQNISQSTQNMANSKIFGVVVGTGGYGPTGAYEVNTTNAILKNPSGNESLIPFRIGTTIPSGYSLAAKKTGDSTKYYCYASNISSISPASSGIVKPTMLISIKATDFVDYMNAINASSITINQMGLLAGYVNGNNLTDVRMITVCHFSPLVIDGSRTYTISYSLSCM